MSEIDPFNISEIIADFDAQFEDCRASSNATRRTLRSQLDIPYGPRPRPSPHARYHAVLDRPLVAGRFRREAGEALCKPATRFWGLALVTTAPVTCPRCLELAERHGVELIDSTTEAGR